MAETLLQELETTKAIYQNEISSCSLSDSAFELSLNLIESNLPGLPPVPPVPRF